MLSRILARKTSVRALLLSAAVVAATSTAAAQYVHNPQGGQEPPKTCDITGQVATDGGGLTTNDMTLELEDAHEHMTVARIPVSPTGDFESSDVPSGDYQVRLIDNSGNVLYQSFATVGDIGTVLNIRLSTASKIERPGSGTVSVGQLKRKIPSKAQKEFEKAQKASEKGDLQTSITHLKKAIEIEPAYMEAYNNLGVRYLKLSQYEAAAEQFQKATELDPNSAPPFLNLGIALFSLNRLPEAEKAARSALRLETTNHHTRLMLGLILLAENKDETEALEQLRSVEHEFPKARVAIAQILARHGDNHQAAGELQTYLKSGQVEDAGQVQTWLAALQAAERP